MITVDSPPAAFPMLGRPQKFSLQLSPEDQEYLEKIVSSRTAQVRHQQRAKILLQRAAGASYAEIEEAVGVTTPTFAKVVKKACAYGARAALDDLKRTGRPDRIPREAKVWCFKLPKWNVFSLKLERGLLAPPSGFIPRKVLASKLGGCLNQRSP